MPSPAYVPTILDQIIKPAGRAFVALSDPLEFTDPADKAAFIAHLAISAAGTDPGVYYFRADGDDGDAGTLAEPWETGAPFIASLVTFEADRVFHLDIGAGTDLGALDFSAVCAGFTVTLNLRGRGATSVVGAITSTGGVEIRGNGKSSLTMGAIVFAGGSVADATVGDITIPAAAAVEGESAAGNGGGCTLRNADAGAITLFGGDGSVDFVSGNGGTLYLDDASSCTSYNVNEGADGGFGAGAPGAVYRRLNTGTGGVTLPASGKVMASDGSTFRVPADNGTLLQAGQSGILMVTNGATQLVTSPLILRNSAGTLFHPAATQDAIQILGRAGGTSNYIAVITTGVLTNSTTVIIPPASFTIPCPSLAQTWTAAHIFTQTVAMNSAVTLGSTLGVTGAATITGRLTANGGVAFPASSAGLTSGAWWDNAGVLTKVP